MTTPAPRSYAQIHRADMPQIARDQADSHDHQVAVGAANRALCALLDARAPEVAKPWQRAACLFTSSGESAGTWGVWATVVVVHPHGDELVMRYFGADWREAIETAVYAVATL